MKLKTMKISALLCILCALCVEIPARAQLTPTYYTNCLAIPAIQCQNTVTNLQLGQYNTNNIWQGRHIGIGLSFVGGASTNTGTIGFQFAVRSKANGVITTTRPFTVTSTANGTIPVVDWAVIPNYNLGPADALVLLAITNATVNVPPSAGGITVSNVWIQMDTLLH
ncbi:MAG TPA: hypothetical protein VG347_11060 [Verrucomicrobiae bacterium]|nr:hypothetical protein [Verrucomicrobiae bacterium]